MTKTLRTDLRISFAILLGLLIVVGVVGAVSVSKASSDVRQVAEDVAPAASRNAAVLQAMTDAETGLRGYGIIQEESALEPYRMALERLPRLRAAMLNAVADDATGRQLAQEQDDAIQTWLSRYATPRLVSIRLGQEVSTKRFNEGRAMFDQIRTTNAALGQHLEGRLAKLRDDADQTSQLIVFGVLTLTGVGLAVGLVTSRVTARRVRRPLSSLREVVGALASGNHGTRATPSGPVEISTIAQSVNALADESDRLRNLEAEEQRLQQRAFAFGRRVRESLDPDEVVRLALTEIGTALELDRAYIRYLSDAGIGSVADEWRSTDVEPLTAEGRELSPGSADMLRRLHADHAPMVMTDIVALPQFATIAGQSWIEATGARAVLGVPVAVDNEPIAVITCIRFEPHDWKAAEIRLAESVASDLGRALDHARLYQRQLEVIDQLRELDQAKDDFMSSVSHELRTPLTSINGYLELLEDDSEGLSPAEHRTLGVIRRNVDRLGSLIEDLLTLSRIEAGAFRTKLAPVDLSNVVRQTVEDLRTQAANGKVALAAAVDDGAAVVSGDETQLARAMLNLVSNAIKFTPPGGRVDVTLSTDADDGQATIAVRDTGMGIPAKDLDLIFDRFFRASNAVSAGVPGTGLGLVIVRTIMTNHGGSLLLESEEGVGTTTTMVLPWRPDAQDVHDIEPVTSRADGS
jgi:two-component system, OmpR family, phosphate regulon sensor histidine kinase PhoR